MAVWELRVRDRNRENVATLEDFASATFNQEFNGVGGWLIKGVPVGSDAATALVPGAGIIALRDGEVIMNGPLLFPTFEWSEKGYVMDVSGASDDLALWARLCYPDAPSLDLNAAYSDDRGPGAAESVMHAYVTNNAGPAADSTRRWAGLTMGADEGRGSSVQYSARLDVLGDVLAELALAGGGLGFHVVQDDDSTDLVFEVYEPTDRSTSAKFNPALGNVRRYTFSRKAGSTNDVIVGGGGEGVLRTFVELGDSISQALWGMRLEGFKDQRQTTDATELYQAATDELEQRSDQVNLDLEPIDTTALSYGPDGYVLGDLVASVVAGETITDTIRSIVFELNSDGERITPTIGTPGAVEAGTSEAQALDVLLNRMETLARRLSRVETAN